MIFFSIKSSICESTLKMLIARLFTTTRPVLFDRAKFFAAKKAWKSARDIESTTLSDAHSILSAYSMGQTTLPITLHVALMSAPKLRGDVVLPKAPSADADRVLVFATPGTELAELAEKLGASVVGGEELVKEVAEGRIDFTRVLSTKVWDQRV